jgi:ABC-2 type transport system permease protein
VLPRIAVVYHFLAYEIKRSIARKKVIVLAFFTLLIGTIVYFLLDYVGKSPRLEQFLGPYQGYIWVVGVFLPQSFFVQFTALLIAGGAMSEEYEAGTAELLLSKPVTRGEYFFGKFLGGYLLLVLIILLNMILALGAATFTFGTQTGLGALPSVFLAQAFAAFLFFSIAFMIGETIRRSSLSYIISSAAFITSSAFGLVLGLLYTVTNTALFFQVQLYLPTSAVSSLPTLVVGPFVPSTVSTLLGLLTFGANVETSIIFSIELILMYSIPAFVIALIFFESADISRRVS